MPLSLFPLEPQGGSWYTPVFFSWHTLKAPQVLQALLPNPELQLAVGARTWDEENWRGDESRTPACSSVNTNRDTSSKLTGIDFQGYNGSSGETLETALDFVQWVVLLAMAVQYPVKEQTQISIEVWTINIYAVAHINCLKIWYRGLSFTVIFKS